MSTCNLARRGFSIELASTALDKQNPVEVGKFPDSPEKVAVLAMARMLDKKEKSVREDDDIQSEVQRLSTEWGKAEDERFSRETLNYDQTAKERERVLAERKIHEDKVMDEYLSLPSVVEKTRLVRAAQEKPETVRDWFLKGLVEASSVEGVLDPLLYAYNRMADSIVFDMGTEKGCADAKEFFSTYLSTQFVDALGLLHHGFVTASLAKIVNWGAFLKDNSGKVTAEHIIKSMIQAVHVHVVKNAEKFSDGRFAGNVVKQFGESMSDQQIAENMFGTIAGVKVHFIPENKIAQKVAFALGVLFPGVPAKPTFGWAVLPVLPPKPVRRDMPDFEKQVKEAVVETEVPHGEDLASRFPLVTEQLKVAMQRLAINGEINQLLEEALFAESKPVSTFAVKYGKAPMVFGETKRVLRKLLDKATILHVQKELDCLHRVLTFRVGALERAKILEKSGLGKKKQNEANLLREVAMVYGELIDAVALELEMKIRCKELVIPNLGNIVETAERLGPTGENVLDILQKAINEAQAAKEVTNS